MNRPKTMLALLFLAMISVACAVIPIQERIVGNWHSDLAGFQVVYEYTSTTVGIVPHAPVPYSLEGDLITFQFEDPQTRKVEFLSGDVMVQTDERTGIRQTFKRKP
jgi:uncharacterized protein YdhG (YjbR/CyaY superfamily)